MRHSKNETFEPTAVKPGIMVNHGHKPQSGRVEEGGQRSCGEPQRLFRITVLALLTAGHWRTAATGLLWPQANRGPRRIAATGEPRPLANRGHW